MSSTKQKRADIVNEIIKEIGSFGRHFFRNGDEYAKMIIKHNRVYMINEWNAKVMPINKAPPRSWHHGGTLWSLAQDFADFIDHGGITNGDNGYGGLYCSHWGYGEEDMARIRNKAKELGYLK